MYTANGYAIVLLMIYTLITAACLISTYKRIKKIFSKDKKPKLKLIQGGKSRQNK